MIISASRRSDIPAFYAQWFWNRLQAGYCTVPNPFNPKQVARISLEPQDVDAFVFWTRHARPLMRLLPDVDRAGFRYYFQYTITGYGPPVEARSPPLDTALSTFRALSDMLPRGAVIWRYDPIVMGQAFPPRAHLSRFGTIARALEGYARRVVVSFMHVYRKTERRMGTMYEWGDDLCREPAADPAVPDMLGRMVHLAQDHGMVVEACAQKVDFSQLGIGPTKCVDDRLLRELFGGSWPSRKDPGQRPECGCVASKDIGMVDTCTFGCAYCYATNSDAQARRRLRDHDPCSPSLVGHHDP